MTPTIYHVVSQVKAMEREADDLIAQAAAQGADPATLDVEWRCAGWGKPFEPVLVKRQPHIAELDNP